MVAENLLRSVVEVCHGERVEPASVVIAVGREVGAAGQLHLKVKVLKCTLHHCTVAVKMIKKRTSAHCNAKKSLKGGWPLLNSTSLGVLGSGN